MYKDGWKNKTAKLLSIHAIYEVVYLGQMAKNHLDQYRGYRLVVNVQRIMSIVVR
jgi:hypothetical protein